VALARRFRQKGCVVYGYDLSDRVPLTAVARVIPGLRWSDGGFAEDLQRVVTDFAIDLVLPLDDAAVPALAAASLTVAKACATEAAATTCFNKVRFQQALPRGITLDGSVTPVYPYPEDWLPAVLKPKFGCGSRGIGYVDQYREGQYYATPTDGTLVAQLRLSEPEYTVDCYFNRAGEFVGASPRRRLRVAGGEVMEAVTEERPDLVALTRRLGERLGLTGPACFQFMHDDRGRPRVTECNARFGGGSTLSCEAGLDMVDYVLREYIGGEHIEAGSGKARPGLFMTRSYEDSFFAQE
jgi:hypothetical protein